MFLPEPLFYRPITHSCLDCQSRYASHSGKMMGTGHGQEQSVSLDPENLGLELRLHRLENDGLFSFLEGSWRHACYLSPFPEPPCSRNVNSDELLLIVQNRLFLFFLSFYFFIVYVYVKFSQIWYLVLKHRGAGNTFEEKIRKKM